MNQEKWIPPAIRQQWYPLCGISVVHRYPHRCTAINAGTCLLHFFMFLLTPIVLLLPIGYFVWSSSSSSCSSSGGGSSSSSLHINFLRNLISYVQAWYNTYTEYLVYHIYIRIYIHMNQEKWIPPALRQQWYPLCGISVAHRYPHRCTATNAGTYLFHFFLCFSRKFLCFHVLNVFSISSSTIGMRSVLNIFLFFFEQKGKSGEKLFDNYRLCI